MGFIGKTNSSGAGKATPFSMANSLPVQTKLSVSKASDPAEKEADTVAKRVVDEQKDKKANTKKGEDKKDTKAPMPITEPTPDTKKEGVKTKEDTEVKKKTEQKEEKKVAKKDAGDKMKDKAGGQDDKKQGVQKKSEQKEEKKAVKKDAGDKMKDKVGRLDDKKHGVQKKSEQKEEKKAAKKVAADNKKDSVSKKEHANNDKKPVDKEKDMNAKPKSIHRKESGTKKDKPVIQQKPLAPVPTNALGRKETNNEHKPEKKDETENDETKLQAVEQKINSKKGSGKALSDQVKSSMEQSFNHDFSHVKIHDDKDAAELCASLNAHAFAIGNDIFFNTGKYDPESDHGRELLAHELTHVVQQKEVVQRRFVQRNPKPSAGKGKSAVTGSVNGENVTISQINLPRFKSRHSARYSAKKPARTKNYKRGTTKQRANWHNEVKDGVASKVKKMIEGATPLEGQYYFGWNTLRLMGTQNLIEENSKVPMWNRLGKAQAFDIDHVVELQLAGNENLDIPDNLELLNYSANRSSGGSIDAEISDKVRELRKSDPKFESALNEDPEIVKAQKTITFDSITYLLGTSGFGSDYWSIKEIKDGDHLTHFRPLTVSEIEATRGTKLNPSVFTSKAGGTILKRADFASLKGFTLKKFDFNNPSGTKAGLVQATVFSNKPKLTDPVSLNMPVYKMDTVLYGGNIKRGKAKEADGLETLLSAMFIKGLSPVEIDSADIIPGKGIVAKGRVIPTVKIIEGLSLDLTIEGDNIEISKTFSSGEIKSIPSPLKISDAAVTVFAGTKGIGVRGNIDFEIKKVGKGQISASAGVEGVFRLEGDFNFDKKLFGGVDAKVKASYEHREGKEDKWDLKGNIKIPANKIKGINEAEINVSYEDKIFKADGTAKFGIPGLEDAKLSVTYGNEQMIIEGEANFKHRLIKSGKINAKVETIGETTHVSLSGKLQPIIPGVNTDLSVDYKDGILTISGTVAYNKGLLSGSVTVGVTNQAVGADGKPSGGAGKNLTVFGGGSLTLKITEWLQGTAGVKFKPNGEIEVMGKIGIPAAVDIFPKKEIRKDVFKAPTIEIPLFAIPVGTHSIGLVATIGGGLEAYASIGPGQLTEAAIEVKYNPADEANMSIAGKAKFRVPADAGLRLSIRAGIGLSIGIARIAGGIELGGALGISGAAEAAVAVNWSPSHGFKLDAEAALSVQPKFKFDVNAYVEAVLDLWVTEFRKEWKWNLYAFEWGPAMKFGVRFPVHYEEKKPFKISLDDVKFEAPDISVGTFAKGIGKQLLG